MPDSTIPGLKTLLEHRSWVRAIARRLVHNAADAEDLAQEAWVRVMRSPPDPDRDPRPWLRRVLQNLARNRWRGERRRTARESAWRERQPQRSPAELVEEADQHQCLVRRVLDLEEPFRTTLVLRYYEGLSPPEIARRLGIAEGTARSRVARAVERLRDRYDEEEDGDRKGWIAALLPLARLDGGVPATATAASSLTGALLMFTKSKLAFLSILALLVVLAGGVWLAGISAGDGPGPQADLGAESASNPTLKGRSPALRAEVPPRSETPADAETKTLVLTGRVVDPRGKAVAGAEVFVLPEGVEGLEADEVAHVQFSLARTDAEGAFRLEPSASSGRLVAFSEGYLPASLPLADAGSKEPIELVLNDGRSVTLRVLGPDGLWPARCAANFDTDWSATFERTADAGKLAFSLHVEPESTARAAEQVFRVATLAPLRVYVDPLRGLASIPRWIDLPADGDLAEFRLVPSGAFHLRIVDDTTGEAPPEDASVRVSIRDLTADSPIVTSTPRRPQLEIRDRLSPGRYGVHVSVEGYVPARATFEIRAPGERTDLVVRLEPGPGGDVGRVLLTATDPEQASEKIRALARTGATPRISSKYVVLLRESGKTQWSDTHAEVLPDGRIDLRPRLLETWQPGLVAGHYDLYVARRDTGTAAFVPGVRVYGGQDNDVAVTLRPGSFFRVTDVVSSDKPADGLEVRAADMGRLPMIHWFRDGYWTLTGPQDVVYLLRTPLQPRVLGPFPAAEIEILLRSADGKTRTVRVRVTELLR